MSIPPEYEEAWKKFEEIARREKGRRGLSELLNEVVADYARKHADGNATYKLDKFEKEFRSFPTAWEAWSKEQLETLKDYEVLEIEEDLLRRQEQLRKLIKDRHGLDGFQRFKQMMTKSGISTKAQR